MTVIQERPISADMAKRILKGPHIIQRLQTEVLEPDIAYAGVVAKGIINKEGYPLSDRQLEIFFTSAPRLVEHKNARNIARNKRLKDPKGFKDEVGQQANFAPSKADIVFHPASITFRLEPESFQRKWNEYRQEVHAQTTSTYPIGFTRYGYFLDIDNLKLPFAFSDVINGGNSTPAHEARHIHYSYLHPEITPSSNEEFSYQTFREQLKGSAEKCVKQSDQSTFRKILQNLMNTELYAYLNERYVRAFEEKPKEAQRDTVSDFFDLNQNTDLLDNVKAVWSGLPADTVEHLTWEKIIFDEFTSIRHKARYIEARYQDLREIKTGSEAAAVLAFLTPEQGYIINAYLLPPGELITVEKMRKWKQEYETYPESDGIVDHWSAFLLEAAQITEYDYLIHMVNRDSSDDPLESRPANFGQVVSFILDNSISVQATAESRVKRLQTVIHHPLLKSGLNDDQRKQVLQQVLEISCDFHDMFYAYYQSFLKAQPFKLTEEEITAFASRSIDLDNAAQELASQLYQGANVDLDRLFKPGFRRSANKIPELIKLKPRDWTGIVFEDPRTDSTLLNGGRVIRASVRTFEVASLDSLGHT